MVVKNYKDYIEPAKKVKKEKNKDKAAIPLEMSSNRPSNMYRAYTGVGLVLCALGDFLLHMEDHPEYGHELWFLTGLVSFLMGHIFLMFAISLKSYTLTKAGFSDYPTSIPVCVIIYVIGILCVIIPNVKKPVLKIGVVLYGGVIGRMLL